MMILVGQLDSPFVRRVAATMTHYLLPFDRHVLSVFGDRDEVARLNPLGRVPALIIDDGEALIESAAIIDYLDELADDDVLLTPHVGARRRQVLRFAAVAMGISERAVQYRHETVRRSAPLRDPSVVENCLRAIRDSMDLLEREINAPWALGEEPTQADFAMTAALTHLTNRIPEFDALDVWPKLSRMREAGEDLEAFRANPFMEG